MGALIVEWAGDFKDQVFTGEVLAFVRDGGCSAAIILQKFRHGDRIVEIRIDKLRVVDVSGGRSDE